MMSPADCFSLVCRSVAEVTPKNIINGHNLPLLLLFRVVMSQRNIAFAHARMDTVALATFMTSKFESAKLPAATQLLADAFHVSVADLDVSARVKVCSLRVCFALCFVACGCAWHSLGGCSWGVASAAFSSDLAHADALHVAMHDAFPTQLALSLLLVQSIAQWLAHPPPAPFFPRTLSAQSRKHVLNQPADLDSELVKAVLNPEALQWSWVARNMCLRTVVVLGSPANDAACPPNMTVADVNVLQRAVNALVDNEGELPLGCRVHRKPKPGGRAGEKIVEKLEWAWNNIHAADPEFHMVLRALQKRFLSGRSELEGNANAAAATDPSEMTDAAFTGSTGAPAAAVSAARPPSGSRKQKKRGTKRRSAPVVPVANSSARSLRHRTTAARVEKGLDMMVAALMEEEQNVSVVRPPFMVGEVKPFSAWPHGGVVILVQFPFLFDTSRSRGGPQKWSANCRKIAVLNVGARYEVVFCPKAVGDAAAVRGDAPSESASTTNAGGGAAAGEDAGGGAAVSDAEADAEAVADAAAAAAAAVAAAVAATEDEEYNDGLGEGDSDGDGDADAGMAEAPRSPRGATAGDGSPAAASGDAEAEGQGAAAVGAGLALFPVPASQPAPSDFVRIPGPLQHRFVRALASGKVPPGPIEDEELEWRVKAQSPTASYSFSCTFTSAMELGRSQRLPCRSLRSNNDFTAAYPARDPRECEAEELD